MAYSANTTAFNAKGRNVTPLSSTLKIQTLPADCSGSAWAENPIDGEWLHFAGYGEAATHLAADQTIDNSGHGLGAMACMVWGHADRSDKSALAQTRIPVLFKESFHCELALYNYQSGVGVAAGDYLVLAVNQTSIGGSTARLVAEPQSDLDPGDYWIVGYVIGGAGVTTEGEPLEVMLYDQPRHITMTA